MSRRPARERGFTYLAVLLFLAAGGAALAAIGTLWHTAAQREREEELLFIGEQFRAAIRSYSDRSPGAAKEFPLKLEDLLEDRRLPTPQRHLRRIFVDPMTRRAEWGLLRRADGRLYGVHSLSTGRAFRTAGFPAGVSGGATYAEWKFTVEAAATKPVPAAGDPGPPIPPGPNPPGPTPPVPPPQPPLPPVDPDPPPEPTPPGRCQEERQASMLRCRELKDPAARVRCEAESSRAYGACLRGLNR